MSEHMLCEDVTSTSFPTVPSIVESEFHILYAVDNHTYPGIPIPQTHDVSYHLHMSGIAIMGLAPEHPIILDQKKISEIRWAGASKNPEKGKIQMSGKRKRGAPELFPNSNVCELICEDGSNYVIKSHIRAKLVESNARLEAEPELLLSDPQFSGFLAILVISDVQKTYLKEHMLTSSQYLLHCKERPSREVREAIITQRENQRHEDYLSRVREREAKKAEAEAEAEMASSKETTPQKDEPSEKDNNGISNSTQPEQVIQ